MKKFAFLLPSLVLSCAVMSAQVIPLTLAANGPRHGDCLQGNGLMRFNDGDGGDGRLWICSDEDVSEQGHSVEYYSLGDTIAVAADGIRYFYRLSGDTLCMLGFDNRTSHVVYSRPLPVLRYPFSCGDSISCTFTGSGMYGDHILLGIAGRCHTAADACGMVVCGADTLTGILRIRHHRETVRKAGYGSLPSLSADSLDMYLSSADGVMVEDIFCYYKPGCRYPVITSVSSSGLHRGQSIPHAGYAVLYAPDRQEYDIHYDPENEAVRAYSASLAGGRANGAPDASGVSDALAGMAAASDGRSVYVHYSGSSSLPVTFTVFDALSRQMSASYTVSSSGDITLPLLHSTRNVLLLHVTCGDSMAVLKIPVGL